MHKQIVEIGVPKTLAAQMHASVNVAATNNHQIFAAMQLLANLEKIGVVGLGGLGDRFQRQLTKL